MKTYIVYLKGVEVSPLIKASGHNAAEEKARKKYAKQGYAPNEVSVAYTEV